MLGDFVPSIFETMHAPKLLEVKYFTVSIAVAFIILPLSTLKCILRLFIDLNALKFTSFAGVLFVIYTTFVIIYRDNFFTDVSDTTYYWNFQDCIVLSVPASCVAFTAHYNGPRYYQELKNRSVKKFTIAVFTGLGICFICYCAAASILYF